ncbi:uncharacterized protein F10E9.5-like [Tachypleus tridentatus]|uniref:uncharacterized protein F10E9.5-like n=1 Tax=Tachypleus tridentatus TaxID=6853 RepID=UPI003FD16695
MHLDRRTSGGMASFSIQHIRSHHRLYDHYWKYYNQMVGWFRHYRMFNRSYKCNQRRQKICRNMHRNVNDSTESQKRFCHKHHDVSRKNCDHSRYSRRGNSHSSRRVTKADLKWNKSKKSQGLVVKGIIKTEEISTNKASEAQLEMEITEEMIAFFEHSAKHREELKAMKKDKYSTEEEQYVSLENMSVTGPFQRSKLPPVTLSSTNRTKEMKDLYGKAVPTIHGMETAMQLSFDRFCDIKCPKLWPNIPLKM